MEYDKKLHLLRDLFGEREISLEIDRLVVDGCHYPIIDDVIILLDPPQYPPMVRKRLGTLGSSSQLEASDFAEDIQYTFGEEWKTFPEIMPEHKEEFLHYFDLIDLSGLKDLRVCDLGCGIGRWSYFLYDKCAQLILLDFSEAIFVARRNLERAENAIFFMGDLKRLPFKNDFADLIVSLGVLHHLPTPALDEIRVLKKYGAKLLIYLYYALDNRPFYFRALFSLATLLRRAVSKSRSPSFRTCFSWFALAMFYLPFITMGTLLRPLGLGHWIPLYEVYRGKSLNRIRQDVYDRFFTKIEQRYSKKEIMALKDAFSQVLISEKIPYWHFVCER
jgi:SAM-dependent methyltransferase